MSAVLMPLPAGDVELDVCLPCQRLWMDHRERDLRLPENAGSEAPSATLPVVRMEGRKHERRAFHSGRGGEDERAPARRTLLSWLSGLLPRRFR